MALAFAAMAPNNKLPIVVTLAFLVALIALVATQFWPGGELAGAPGGPQAVAVEEPARQPIEVVEAEPVMLEERRVVEPVSEPEVAVSEVEPVEALIRTQIRGRVLDVEGRPFPGVTVGPVSPEDRWRATSDPAGYFLIEEDGELPVRGLEISVQNLQYQTLASCAVTLPDLGREHIVVATRALELSGRVVDPSGEGIEGAWLMASSGRDLLADFPYPLGMARYNWVDATAMADGRFKMERAPIAKGARIHVQRAGFIDVSIPMPTTARADLLIQLEPRLDSFAEGEIVSGRVLLPDLSPARGATVTDGMEQVTTDQEGRFQLPYGGRAAEDAVLAASHRDHGVTVVASYGQQAQAASPLPPGPLEIVLSARHSISGVVIGADGSPRTGWMVLLKEGTQLSGSERVLARAEDLGHGAADVTRGDGAFRLSGLADRTYVLLIFDPRTLVTVHTGPLPAGSEDVLIEIPADAAHARITGRVVSRRGLGLPGVTVQAKMVTKRGKRTSNAAYSSTSLVSAKQQALTDSEGRFELNDISSQFVFLEMSGEDILPATYEFKAEAPVDDIRVEVSQRCHFRVTRATELPEGAWLQVEDSSGEALAVFRFSAGSVQSWSGGGSVGTPVGMFLHGVMTVSEDAHELVLRTGEMALDEETDKFVLHDATERRIPMQLQPGQVVEIVID